jgi:hypothetical protein
MPEICRFYGIIIRMYFETGTHSIPHFHARYGDYEASIQIDNLSILAGELPPKAIALVMEWASMHRKELLKNYRNAAKGKPLLKIKPLE